MVGIKNEGLMCCFCGNEINRHELVELTISSINEKDEQQQLFCHKKCLLSKIHPIVPLHPDLIE